MLHVPSHFNDLHMGQDRRTDLLKQKYFLSLLSTRLSEFHE